jgi:hypothetical protein
MRLVGMGAAAGMSPEAIFGFGMAGAGVARQNLLSSRQGFDLFVGAAMGGTHGLSRDELAMVGGRTGAAAMIAQTKMGAALSPMGDVALMALMGGNALGGAFDMGAAALGTMGEGDMMGNMIRFQTHKRELMRGVGAGGINTIARSQLDQFADIMMEMAPTLSQNDARRFTAMNVYGMNEVQAKAYVASLSGGGGGGGGGGGYGYAAQLEASQELRMSRWASGAGAQGPPTMERIKEMILGNEMNPGETVTKFAAYGAGLGLAVGTPKAAIVGGIVGAVAGIGYSAYNFFSRNADMITEGPGVFASPEAKADWEFRKQAERYDRELSAYKKGIGYLDIDADYAAAVRTADYSRAHLSLDAVGSPVASANTYSNLLMAGLRPVMAGPGTVEVQGQYFSATEVQGLARRPLWNEKIGKTTERNIAGAAYRVAFEEGSESRRSEIEAFGESWKTISGMSNMRLPGFVGRVMGDEAYGRGLRALADEASSAAEDVLEKGRALVLASGDKELIAEWNKGAITNPKIQKYLSEVSGLDIRTPDASSAAGISLAVSAKAGVEESKASASWMFYSAYGRKKTVSNAAEIEEAVQKIQSGNYKASKEGREELQKLDPESYALYEKSAAEFAGGGGGIEAQRAWTRRAMELSAAARGAKTTTEREDKYAEGERALYSDVISHEAYGRLREAHARGDKSAAKEAVDTLKREVGLKHRGVHGEDQTRFFEGLLKDEKIARPGASVSVVGLKVGAASVKNLSEVVAASGVLPEGMSEKILSAGAASAASLRGMADVISGEAATTSGIESGRQESQLGTTKKKRAMTGMRENAVGFGEQESAMATINRALKQTAGMIDSLDKKVRGPGASPPDQTGKPSGVQ